MCIKKFVGGFWKQQTYVGFKTRSSIKRKRMSNPPSKTCEYSILQPVFTGFLRHSLPWRPTISATCSDDGTGTHSVMFWLLRWVLDFKSSSEPDMCISWSDGWLPVPFCRPLAKPDPDPCWSRANWSAGICKQNMELMDSGNRKIQLLQFHR